jgi:hypothetical protein
MAIDNGPATGNGVVPTGVGVGIEVHVGNPPSFLSLDGNGTGVNPFPPSAAPFVDPGQAGFSGQSPVVPINKTVAFGNTGATVVIANPA